jgi:hypothetical protein
MSREIISVYAFRSPLKGVVEYPVVNVAAAANGSEQQSSSLLVTNWCRCALMSSRICGGIVTTRVSSLPLVLSIRHRSAFAALPLSAALGSVRCVTARVTVSTLQSLLRSFRRSSDTSPKRRPHHAASNTKALHCAVLSSAPSLSAIVCSSTVEAMGTFRFGLALWP